MMSARPSAALICALALIACVSPAHAADDGGTRSVFASGAGNRALALGGAFVGLADDASAMIWNPAGLGIRQRFEILATHAEYADLGSQQDFVAVVLPNWRWGTAGWTWRPSSARSKPGPPPPDGDGGVRPAPRPRWPA